MTLTKLSLSIAILVLTALANCCPAGEVTSADGDTDSQTSMKIQDISWTLVALNGESFTHGERRKAPTLRLDSAAGTAAGTTGVNQFTGDYEIDGPSLKFAPAAVTRRAGFPEAMELETRYLEMLSKVDAWQVSDGKLELMAATEVVASFTTAAEASDDEASSASITGTASFRERIALPPQAVFEATLEDVSRADAAAEVLGKVRIDPAGNPPYAFEIFYDPGAIDERHTYVTRAKVTVDDELVFTSDTAHPVLTRGTGKSVEILLKRSAAD
jgi:putative lipoprotein